MDWFWYPIIYVAGAATFALIMGFMAGLHEAGHVSDLWEMDFKDEKTRSLMAKSTIFWPLITTLMIVMLIAEAPAKIANLGRKIGSAEIKEPKA